LVGNRGIAANIGKILGNIGKVLVGISKILAGYLLNISGVYNRLNAIIGGLFAAYLPIIVLLLAFKVNIFAILFIIIG